ncbi:MAG: protein translocase subunit SecF [Salinisphaeraceae bacterium]|jgi:preprotein translocase subunit SecF|nr:protein translocase subunit SecF [Salinisphaeraceae bacterium]
MRLIKSDTHFNFTGQTTLAAVFSAILIIVSLASVAIQQLELGIDFTGGVVVEIGYPEAVDLEQVRSTMASAGYPDAIVQNFGTTRDVLIRLVPKQAETGELDSADISSNLLESIQAESPGAEMRRVEFVGPQIGEELTEKGGLALLFALFGILIYVIFRFHWKLALGSVAALAHDVIITVGVFSLLRIEFDLTVLAALLAVIGYSLNDTIVVFDRIRENFRRMRKAGPREVVNESINQMLARTIMTSGTTLLTLIALFTLGGEVIHAFATALIIGVVVGTYSSIYVASALALRLDITKEDLFPPKEEEAEQHM